MERALVTFGKTVRSIREDKNLSQEALAELAGLHRTYIGGVERGERNVGLLNILRISQALRTRPADLFREIR